jgi:DNA-binding CsgD family transcriptional regulator
MRIEQHQQGTRYYFPEISETFYLGNRQAMVVYLRISGKKTKEVAEITGLSIRTIESYLYNVKDKSPFDTLKEAIEIIKKTDFIKQANFKFNN